MKNHHKIHKKCLRISIAFLSSILIQFSSILELNLGSNLAPGGLHLGSMGKQKINFGFKKASRFNFNRFFNDFHRFGTSIRELWAPTSFPKSWKNVIFITLLKQCTSSGINHHSKCSQISIAFLFLIWTRCMSEIHQKTLKNKKVLNFRVKKQSKIIWQITKHKKKCFQRSIACFTSILH